MSPGKKNTSLILCVPLGIVSKNIKVYFLFCPILFIMCFLFYLDCLSEYNTLKSLGILVLKIFPKITQEREERISDQMQLKKAKFILLPICLLQGKSWNQEVSEVNLPSWNNPKPESPEPPDPNSNTPNLGVREQDVHFFTLYPSPPLKFAGHHL